MSAVTALVNEVYEVYEVYETGLWAPECTRTTVQEVASLTRAGKIVVARLNDFGALPERHCAAATDDCRFTWPVTSTPTDLSPPAPCSMTSRVTCRPHRGHRVVADVGMGTGRYVRPSCSWPRQAVRGANCRRTSARPARPHTGGSPSGAGPGSGPGPGSGASPTAWWWTNLERERMPPPGAVSSTSPSSWTPSPGASSAGPTPPPKRPNSSCTHWRWPRGSATARTAPTRVRQRPDAIEHIDARLNPSVGLRCAS
jgi:hypothetical protein